MTRLIMLMLAFTAQGAWSTSDDALAHRMMSQARYAEAAPLFADPFWRGIALYRAEQWANAAEAFAMSPNPMARYNLANCYAKLGHYGLALDTYTHVLRDQPDFRNADDNARLMRALMEKEEEQKGKNAQPPPSQDSESEENLKQEAGSAAQPETREGQSTETPTAQKGDASSQIKNGQLVENDTIPQEQQAVPASSGQQDGESDSNTRFLANREREQAQETEQWLSTIEDRPGRFLKARIELEMRRRAAAGTLTQEAGSAW